MKIMKDNNYYVICRWDENDGEVRWDVVSSFNTFEEAMDCKNDCQSNNSQENKTERYSAISKIRYEELLEEDDRKNPDKMWKTSDSLYDVNKKTGIFENLTNSEIEDNEILILLKILSFGDGITTARVQPSHLHNVLFNNLQHKPLSTVGEYA
jgi:hypothetical protein